MGGCVGTTVTGFDQRPNACSRLTVVVRRLAVLQSAHAWSPRWVARCHAMSCGIQARTKHCSRCPGGFPSSTWRRPGTAHPRCDRCCGPSLRHSGRCPRPDLATCVSRYVVSVTLRSQLVSVAGIFVLVGRPILPGRTGLAAADGAHHQAGKKDVHETHHHRASVGYVGFPYCLRCLLANGGAACGGCEPTAPPRRMPRWR